MNRCDLESCSGWEQIQWCWTDSGDGWRYTCKNCLVTTCAVCRGVLAGEDPSYVEYVCSCGNVISTTPTNTAATTISEILM